MYLLSSFHLSVRGKKIQSSESTEIWSTERLSEKWLWGEKEFSWTSGCELCPIQRKCSFIHVCTSCNSGEISKHFQILLRSSSGSQVVSTKPAINTTECLQYCTHTVHRPVSFAVLFSRKGEKDELSLVYGNGTVGEEGDNKGDDNDKVENYI